MNNSQINLETITPEAVRALDDASLLALAEALRRRIIDQVSVSGGHLASNLGVVELTIALVRVFDFPNDRLIFDVGHQSYAWKLLTGRADRFQTLRQADGLSGFPKRNESPYDAFETGHSSTSISAAVGMARAFKLSGEKRRVVALIGDGALSGGMAFEAMNDLAHGKDDVMVILNDNQMSIEKVVGGLARHLERIRISRRYRKLKRAFEPRLEKLGWLGAQVARLMRWVKRHGRRLIASDNQNVLFEQLGFHYYGPIDGHDLATLNDYLTRLKDQPGPVLLHVCTTKGKGYDHAESRPTDFHGVAPFVVENGVAISKGTAATYSSVFGDTLTALARRDERIVAISAAMTSGTGLRGFERTFPERFYDVGIAEQHAVSLAAGLASAGMRPVVALYSTFLQRAVDQLIHDVCLQNLPVVFAIDRAGAVPADGPTHQGYYDLAIAKLPPNLKTYAPTSAGDLKRLLAYAVTADGPVLIRYPRSGAAESLEEPSINGITERTREGEVAILQIGALTDAVDSAREKLQTQGILCRHLLTICTNPFDFDGMMNKVESTSHLFIVEDGAWRGGVAETIMCGLLDRGYSGQIKRRGHEQLTAGQASRAHLLESEGMDGQSMADWIMQTLHQTSRDE